MIHPSYFELMDSINEAQGEGYARVQSRYSVVIAAAKRARQLTDGAPPRVAVSPGINKVLSTAVDELNSGKVHLLPPKDTESGPDEGWAPEEETAVEAASEA